MPTGYTAKIAEGDITFQQFAMNCARAFGACITLREEPGGGEVIPERFEPSLYHVTAKAGDQAALQALYEMTFEQQTEAADKVHVDAEARRLQRIEGMEMLRVKYTKMLSAVYDWVPPTARHHGLKVFMIEQLKDSIKFDCEPDYYLTPTPRLTPGEWVEQQVQQLTKSIERHDLEQAEEVERTNTRNAWIAALRDSLK